MKKLVVATAAILAATLVSGSAFAIPGTAAKTLEAAPSSAIKVSCGCHHRPHYYHRGSCCGYYSLYTYVVPCNGGCGCGGCGYGGYTWRCGGFFGGIFGW